MNPKHIKSIARIVTAIMLLALLVGLTPGAVRPAYAAPGDLTRVSVDSAGVQANGSSGQDMISDDGRFVVFESAATNLAGGTGGLFLKDRQTGATTRISIDGENPSISNDGHFIAYASFAASLVRWRHK